MSPDTFLSSRALRNNRGLKLLSILLAVVVWYTIHELTSNETMIRNVPLKFLLNDGWSVLDTTVQDVDVMFRGSQGDIRFLNRDQVSMEVDLRHKSQTGSVTVRMKPSDVQYPGVARPVLIEPSEITLSLDREGSKLIPVSADIIGQPPAGYDVVGVVCSPSNVLLRGPHARLEWIKELKTVPIDLEGRVRSFELVRAVTLPDEAWTARIEPDRVTVMVQLMERSTHRILEKVEVRVLADPGATGRVEIDPPSVNISLRGHMADEVNAAEVLAMVNCADLGPGEHRDVPVLVRLPAGTVVDHLEPKTVTVRIGAP